MEKKKVELLAPAGDMERLKVAIKYGADAVYFGMGNFNARRNAQNFSTEAEIKEAIEKIDKSIELKNDFEIS